MQLLVREKLSKRSTVVKLRRWRFHPSSYICLVVFWDKGLSSTNYLVMCDGLLLQPDAVLELLFHPLNKVCVT